VLDELGIELTGALAGKLMFLISIKNLKNLFLKI
jgi:hypothetical protein